MTKRKYRLCAALLITGLLSGRTYCLASSQDTGRTALDAFNALSSLQQEHTEEQAVQEQYLDQVMSGRYAAVPEEINAALEMAMDLTALCRISNSDLAAYASKNGLLPAQVRNAYYKALANVLRAQIITNPSSDERYRDVQAILQLFLSDESTGGSEAEKAVIRTGMTHEYEEQLVGTYNLPRSFVEFLIMDSAWEDDDWKNDNDWKKDAGWYADASSVQEEVIIGSRDQSGTETIKKMQERLIALGYLRGEADGIFGPKTQAALLEFQAANGLRSTGTYTVQEDTQLSAADAVPRWAYDDDFWDPEDWDDDDRYEYDDDNYYDDADEAGDDGYDGYEYDDDRDDDDGFEYDDNDYDDSDYDDYDSDDDSDDD